MKKLIVLVFVFFLLVGCNNSTKYTDIMNRAYELVDSKPDSAASLLNTIDAPGNLPPSAKADYGYLKNLAYHKVGKPNTEDSIILFTMDYYKNNNNTGRLSRTYELLASYYNQKNNMTSALKTAGEGLQYNIEMNDSAEIAHSYDILAKLSKGDFNNAIRYLHKASLYDTKGSYWRDYSIGVCYTYERKADSSSFFYKKKY